MSKEVYYAPAYMGRARRYRRVEGVRFVERGRVLPWEMREKGLEREVGGG